MNFMRVHKHLLKIKILQIAEKVAEDIGVFEANDIPEEKSQQEAKKIEEEINAEIDKTLEEVMNNNLLMTRI